MTRFLDNERLRQKNKIMVKFFIRHLSGPFLCVLIFFSVFSNAFGDTNHMIFFYNPESNLDNFATVKTRLDTYLGHFGPYHFQPFADRETFEKIVCNRKDGILILSSWHYEILKKKIDISPVLVGVIDGKTTQKKVLYAKKKFDTLKKLREMSITSAGSEEYTRNLLRLAAGEKDDGIVDSFSILKVPKDVDALISVDFDLAQAALTSEHSIIMLTSIYPKLGKKLIPIIRAQESLLSIVTIPVKYKTETARLPVVIENMEKHEEGREILHILGLDGWKKPGVKELEMLEKREQKL
ncbi:hypothetical protein QUF76_10390 [Desulfobacterales bacterium HSG16]|nr:hypothetical protein [Desulfobacterales bacterium HSG16]